MKQAGLPAEMGRGDMPRRKSRYPRPVVKAAIDRIVGQAGGWDHEALRRLAKEVPNIHEIHRTRNATTDFDWSKICDCARSLEPAVNLDDCKASLSGERPLAGISFAESFELNAARTERTIEDFSREYWHLSLTLDGASIVLSRCDLKDETYEGTMPAYEYWRADDNGTYSFKGGYFKNDGRLFLVGSKTGSSDARLHVFKITEDNEGLQGVMAGVTHWGEPFAGRCYLTPVRDGEEKDLSKPYSFADLRGRFENACTYLAEKLPSMRPIMVIEIGGMEMTG